MRVNTYLQEISFTFPKIAHRKVHNFPLWKYSVSTIITTLCELPRKQSNSNEYKSLLNNILNSLPNYTQIYMYVIICMYAILQALKFIDASENSNYNTIWLDASD